MDHDVEVRLQRSGLTDDQIKTAFEEFDSLDAEGQAGFRRWLDSVSDPDIKNRFGGTDAQADTADLGPAGAGDAGSGPSDL